MGKKYTEKHEWIETDGSQFTVGITHYAQEQLGDVVAIELPEIGKSFAAEDECAVIESVKAASEIYSPIAGEITAVNEELADNPALVNEDPEGAGWLWQMRGDGSVSLDHLMDKEAYDRFVEESE